MFWIELANKTSYKANISEKKLKLSEWQELDQEAWKIRATKKLSDSYKKSQKSTVSSEVTVCARSYLD